jgi:tetratricopeptide (TPR) repeat protein
MNRLAQSLALCDEALSLAENLELQALILAIRADILKASGDLPEARRTGIDALCRAIRLGSVAIVHHISAALGVVHRDLGQTDAAAACFELAERTAIHSPDACARARAQRLELRSEAS